MFNDDSTMLSSDFDVNHCSSDEFNINFDKKPSQSFGLGYWMKTNNVSRPSLLPCHITSDKSVFISNNQSNDICLSSTYQKPKKPKNSELISPKIPAESDRSQSRFKISETIDYEIPKLKISKHVVKKHLKTHFPKHCLPLESGLNLHSSKKEKRIKRSKLKLSSHDYESDCTEKCCSASKDSRCLEKSFEKPSHCLESTSKSQLRSSSHDFMHLTLTIDDDMYRKYCSPSQNIPETSKINNYFRSNKKIKEIKPTEKLLSSGTNRSTLSTENTSSLLYPDSNRSSLSFSCDIPSDGSMVITESNKKIVNGNSSAAIDSSCQPYNVSTGFTSRKRNLSSLSEVDNKIAVSPKRQLIEHCSKNESIHSTDLKEKCCREMTPLEFVIFLRNRLKMYENSIIEKYCLSQPNAMKFLAESHATNWESYKNNVNQMHLVPCGFLNEIFHRLLYCFGLEKKMINETQSDNSMSPLNDCYTTPYSLQYKKLRDEYSFSLKRVRYGIGVIDELFRRKVTYQNNPQTNDVPTVRKWKHIIYYLCLHAKSAFMAKEIQYHNYAQFPSNPFETTVYMSTSYTPSVRCLSNISMETYAKSQLPKDNSKLFDCKTNQKASVSPEHLSPLDMDTSPHSNDSGKGSSIIISSNPNSLVSGGHTTSSLNSTPYSTACESQLHIPGYQLYRIDEYQATANDYVRLLPDAAQLHSRIVHKIGTEPNANSCDNIIKLIYYSDICQQLCKDELMSECLERLLTRVVRL